MSETAGSIGVRVAGGAEASGADCGPLKVGVKVFCAGSMLESIAGRSGEVDGDFRGGLVLGIF
jgi:hypothetical protein